MVRSQWADDSLLVVWQTMQYLVAHENISDFVKFLDFQYNFYTVKCICNKALKY